MVIRGCEGCRCEDLGGNKGNDGRVYDGMRRGEGNVGVDDVGGEEVIEDDKDEELVWLVVKVGML